VEHTELTVNGVRLHVVVAGPESGELVVFLHGFPEFWYAWRKQIPAFAEAGYRVLVPDLRGYNTSDKPKGLFNYSIDKIADDVRALIESKGRSRAVVVGHDWGAAIAFWFTARHPDCVARLAILNGPHPSALRRSWLLSAAQLRRSLYLFWFQLPKLPEWAWFFKDCRMGIRTLKTSLPGTFSDSDIELYRQAWKQPDAITAQLNWYRNFLLPQPRLPQGKRIRRPTLIMWGKKDVYLGPEVARASLALVDHEDRALVLVDEATHFIQHEFPEEVNRRLLEFAGKST
jgi:pimeloyl-ACP methyl ester carboxylesterase